MPMDLDRRVRDRLDRDRNVWLCTLRPDGSPHVTPVWFLYREDTFWVGSAARNRKVRNIDADPRVSLALENGDAPVVAEGRATVLRADFPAEIVYAFHGKYAGWDVTVPVPGEGPRTLLRIPVTRWLLAGRAR
ncbi:TIGR03618 family F420-dependent PPOX class oxidoreductase [Plantactinospora sp. BB1]|uniref:TIGR03618 family F420-dependent PPOX class oxidoreductase n=1 Tax=Plantactinospora sp. BB1 TaxID=2071627 RepID=UPI0018FEB573|nr:TIGR03618 family F420-dependent PPOX class oxidoreductase [Plantactinospora sp. BB1]